MSARRSATRAPALMLHVTPTSANAKTGPILVTTTSAITCPDACPFRRDADGGCYADGGPLALHWRAVTSGARGAPWSDALEILRDALRAKGARALWRHNQAGDLPGDRLRIDRDRVGALVAVNAYADARGFTYTHYPLTADDAGGDADAARSNLAVVAEANASGFTINASANGLDHADRIADAASAAGARVPITAVVAADHPGRSTTAGGRAVVVCPAQQRDGVSCASCRLCARSDRGAIVAFRAHGAGAKRATAAISKGGAR